MHLLKLTRAFSVSAFDALGSVDVSELSLAAYPKEQFFKVGREQQPGKEAQSGMRCP